MLPFLTGAIIGLCGMFNVMYVIKPFKAYSLEPCENLLLIEIFVMNKSAFKIKNLNPCF